MKLGSKVDRTSTFKWRGIGLVCKTQEGPLMSERFSSYQKKTQVGGVELLSRSDYSK